MLHTYITENIILIYLGYSWDEPSKKATFDISIYAPAADDVLSNTKIVKQIWDDQTNKDIEYKTVHFETTPKMSTYLLAIVIGRFDFVEDRVGDTLVRVYTPIGLSVQGQFSLDCCLRGLEFYEHFFGIPYPLKKYDCVAVPDLMAGAMENWGLTTFKESRILVDPENSSAESKGGVALTVLHELSHQWFGNLVTMKVR